MTGISVCLLIVGNSITIMLKNMGFIDGLWEKIY